jgi:hypothetical protein
MNAMHILMVGKEPPMKYIAPVTFDQSSLRGDPASRMGQHSAPKRAGNTGVGLYLGRWKQRVDSAARSITRRDKEDVARVPIGSVYAERTGVADVSFFYRFMRQEEHVDAAPIVALSLYRSHTILAFLRAQQNDRLRLLTLQALVHLHSFRVFSYLCIFLQDPASSVREETVRILGALGDSRAIDPLIVALSDRERSIRCEAARALSRLVIP